jgi:hypothetical protein
METFTAGVQYDDWVGTAAADNAHPEDLAKFLEAKELLDRKTEFLVATSIWIGENNNGVVRPPYIDAFIAPRSDFESVAEHLKSEPDPLDLKRVHVELTLEEFIGLFKRFNVVLTKKGLNLNGRAYNAT